MNANIKTVAAVYFMLILAALSTTGCTSPWKTPKMFSLNNSWPFRDKDAPREGVPVRIVGTWTDTVYTQAGQNPQRGFGGRLMFYERDNKDPILVDGQLVVYAFDETERDPTNNKPTRRYVFPADQMSMHMSKSDLGASYSFWLPWDEIGGPQTEVSLICRFEPTAGGVISSEQTRHLLPGPTRTAGATAGATKAPKVPEGVPSRSPRQTLENMQTSRNADRQAQLAHYEMPLDQQPATGAVTAGYTQPVRQMTATTISLPHNYQMPDVATVNSMSQTSGQRSAQNFPPQMSPNSSQLLLPAAPTQTYTPAMPNVPIGITHPYAGVQQQQFQKPIVQQPAMQNALPQQPMTALPAWPQMTNQVSPATAINYPAAGQLPPR